MADLDQGMMEYDFEPPFFCWLSVGMFSGMDESEWTQDVIGGVGVR